MQTDREFSSVVQLPDFPGRSVVTRTQAPDDPHQATAATIERMKDWATRDANSPQVIRATSQASIMSGPQEEDRSAAIHQWISTHCKFREDDPVLRIVLGLEDELEMLITPARLLSMRTPAGDCDCLTTLCMSMHLCAGIPVEPVTIKADREEPDRDSHVYCQAILENGNLILDPAMGCKHHWPAGAEAPDYLSKDTWGVIHPQRPTRKGLHGLLGLGQGCTDNDPACTSDTGLPGVGGAPGIDIGVPAPPGFAIDPVTGDIYNKTTGAILGSGGPGGYTAASGGINWTQLASVLGADATQITKLATLPSGYTLNAAGQPVLVGTAGLTSLLSSPMVLLLGGGLLLFAAIGRGK